MVILSTVAVLGPSLANAAPIVGNLSLSQNGTQVFAVNSTKIDFNFTGTVSAGFPPVATSGTVTGNDDNALFDITSASTGSFAPLIGTSATVHDLDIALEPTGVVVALPHFITFAAQPLWDITLTEVLPGIFSAAPCSASAAVGQTCTPPGSPFNLTNEAGGQVAVSFSYIGRASDGLGNFTNVSGTFQTTFSNTTYQAILAVLQGGGAVVTGGSGTLGATAAATVPEPGSTSLALIGGALLMISALSRRKQRQ